MDMNQRIAVETPLKLGYILRHRLEHVNRAAKSPDDVARPLSLEAADVKDDRR